MVLLHGLTRDRRCLVCDRGCAWTGWAALPGYRPARARPHRGRRGATHRPAYGSGCRRVHAGDGPSPSPPRWPFHGWPRRDGGGRRYPSLFRSVAIVDIGPEAWRQNWVDTQAGLARMRPSMTAGGFEGAMARRQLESGERGSVPCPPRTPGERFVPAARQCRVDVAHGAGPALSQLLEGLGGPASRRCSCAAANRITPAAGVCRDAAPEPGGERRGVRRRRTQHPAAGAAAASGSAADVLEGVRLSARGAAGVAVVAAFACALALAGVSFAAPDGLTRRAVLPPILERRPGAGGHR